MEGKKSIFQIVTLVVFGVFLVAGVALFAGFGGFGGPPATGRVVIWGPFPESYIAPVLSALTEEDSRFAEVSYAQRDAATFDTTLANALASGTGPDLVILSHEQIIGNESKILPIPFTSLPRQTFVDTFVQEAELFLGSEGAFGLPVAVDPLVMYWNRDLFSAAGLAQPPKEWIDMYTVAEKVTKRELDGSIERAAVAIGEYGNVAHAKELFTMLMMQVGGRVTTRTGEGVLRSALGYAPEGTERPAEKALRFYTQFADPSKIVYSWNRSLPESRDAFARGDVGIYFGYASELPVITEQNPNLNFGVAAMPQATGTNAAVTFGRIYALAITRATQNPAGAATVAYELSNQDASRKLALLRGTPSPRRDLLAEPADGPSLIFRNMALIARAWLDPNPTQTDEIFRKIIEGVTSGASRLPDAVDRADQTLDALLQ